MSSSRRAVVGSEGGSAAPAGRADRRAEIVHVAYRHIAERGLEGLRFADVARDAGINNGTLLYYFASKDALIQAVGAYLVEQFSQTSQPPDATAPLDPLAQLRWEFVDARGRLADQASVVYTELLARAQRDAAVAGVLRDIDVAWRGWLEGVLERGRASGVFRADIDAPLAASIVMAATRGVGMLALVGPDASAVEPVMDALGALIEGWVTGGGHTTQAEQRSV